MVHYKLMLSSQWIVIVSQLVNFCYLLAALGFRVLNGSNSHRVKAEVVVTIFVCQVDCWLIRSRQYTVFVSQPITFCSLRAALGLRELTKSDSCHSKAKHQHDLVDYNNFLILIFNMLTSN